MKKLLLIFSFFVLTISVKAQFTKPAGAVSLPTYSFFRNPADSSITIYQGTVNLYNTFLMKWDSVKIKGYFTNWKILQYRKLNNHDSLSKLDERSFQSLTDTVTWGLGLSQTGHITKVDTASASILSRERALKEYALIVHTHGISSIIGLLDSLNNHYTKAQADARFASIALPNDTWTKVYDYAGNLTNGWKKSKDNIFEFAGILGINSFYHVLNSGVNEIANIPLSTASTTGTEHGFEMTVGGNKIMKISAKVSATGTADSTRVTFSPGTMLGFGKNAKASIDIEAGTAARAPIQMASGDTTGINKAGAFGYNGATYYGHDGSGLKHFAYVNDSIYSQEIASNGQNNIYIGFKLKNSSKIFYNGNFLDPSRWSGVGKDTILLNLNTMVYDHLFIHN